MNDSPRAPRDIQAAPAPHVARQATRQIGPGWLKGFLATLSVIILLITGAGYATVGSLGNELASASNLNLGRDKEEEVDGATDILLVGSDSRTDAQGNPLPEEELARLNAGEADGEENTDTMMVVRVPNDGSRATAVSLPRDTYVHDDNFGNMKLNGVFAAYKSERRAELLADADEAEESMSDAEIRRLEEQATEAGRQGLLDAVAQLTGVDIDHFAEIGLYGFVLLTDAIGGVDVCLNEAVDDPLSGANFPAGEQTLNGLESLAFVRQRHGLPRGDIDRIVRQQVYMASLVNKILSSDTLTSPGKLNDMAKAVEKSVVIDEDWDVLSFATQLANLAGGNVVFTTIPVTSIDGVGDYGESIVTVDVAQVHKFMEDMVVTEEEAAAAETTESESAPAPDTPAALDGVSVHVLNATSTSGLAGNVGQWLEEEGITVEEVNNAQPGVYYVSQVVAADPSSAAAQALAELLGGLEITANAGLDADTIIVVTADDYAGPMSNVPLETSSEAAPEEPVGTPGSDFGAAEPGPKINAGGTGPRCVN